MNGFEKHGIEHLSPSSLNLFTANPAAFVLQKVLKKVTAVGAGAHRGTAVETGVVHGLLESSASLADCVKKAQAQFSQLTALSGDPRLDKEKDAIAAFVERGLMELKPLGVVESTQGRVEYQVEGLKVPIMGYYDLKFWNGPIVDLKTSHSLPSSPSHPHCRQVAFYVAAAGEQDGRLAYVTPKKSATYKVEDVQAHIDAVAKVALTIQRFLSVSSDPMELAGLVSPDVDSFYFSEPLTRKMVNEVWGV